jgi:DNA-binding transcriptional regulator YdaS (Cro superfamily)
MPSSVHSRAVQKAVQLAGGRQALADRLGLDLPDIEAWIAGQRRPPMAQLLQIIDLILDETD